MLLAEETSILSQTGSSEADDGASIPLAMEHV